MNGYLLQAIAIPLWWAGMYFSSRVYKMFAFPGMEKESLFIFVVPDLLLICGASLLVLFRPSQSTKAIILGGFLYGSLWCLTTSIMTGGGYLSTAAMLLGSGFNVLLCFDRALFKPSSKSSAANMMMTIFQSVVIWTGTLIILPLIIVHACGQWPLQVSMPFVLSGGTIFIVASFLGIWSGSVMARQGDGTPFPGACAKRLVIAGPYAYVRNPMAVAGLSQGLGVAIILASWEVAVYVLLGMVVWNLVVRPKEESYLTETFGDQFRTYQKNVRCWLPRRPRRDRPT